MDGATEFENGIVGKYGLNVKKLSSDIDSNSTKRFVEASAYLRDAGYRADSFVASGTKQDIIAKLSEDSFPESLNYTFAQLLNMLEDL